MPKLPLFARAERGLRSPGRGGISAVADEPAPPPAFQALRLPAHVALRDLTRRWVGLGPVLWLWRAPAGSAPSFDTIAGWRGLNRIGPDGVCEALRLYSADGCERARLCLLPDSDYLVWEHVLAGVPCTACDSHQGGHHGLREAAWSRLGPRWHASLVRFRHAHACDNGDEWLLAMPVRDVSAPGARRAAEICAALDARVVD